MIRVFDGHNDVLSRLWQAGNDPVAGFERPEAHINAAACAQGGFAGGFFAIYSPLAREPSGDVFQEDGVLEEPLAQPLPHDFALISAIGQVGIAKQLEAAGHIQIVTRAEMLKAAFDQQSVACILHLEGAECIGPELFELDALHGAGLRSLGPVWSRPNIFGHGVPFAHNKDGDTGPGLTEHGARLAARCVDLGILLDCSHITARGFWDIAELGQPVMATHSNAWHLCRSSRNLTDDQLACIRETDGIVGFNFEPAFISETGWKTGRASLDDCVRQIDYLIAALGEDRVALGSDFDGARTPVGIGSAADLPVLVDALERAGYDISVIEKICNKNWLGFLARHLERT